jgi:uncharacterized membrane protein YphA (DoxX/SURF4 family)
MPPITVEPSAPVPTALSLGRVLLGTAVVGSGLLQLALGRFVRLAPEPTMWRPFPAPFAYAFGVVLVVLGLGILTGRLVRTAATVLSGLLVFNILGLYLPTMIENPVVDTPFLRGFMYTNPLKCLALIGGCALVAAAWPDRLSGLRVGRGIGRFAWLAPVLLAAFLVVAGFQHFWYRAFVDRLVPAWIPPSQRFWTLFTGTALMAAGIGMLVPRTARLAATLAGAMILSWVVLLHVPRAVAGPDHRGETSGVFEALALGGVALMVGAARRDAHT